MAKIEENRFPLEVDYSECTLSLSVPEAATFYDKSIDQLQPDIQRGDYIVTEDRGETRLVLPASDLKTYWESLTDDERTTSQYEAVGRLECPPRNPEAYATTNRLIVYGRVSDWPIIYYFRKRKIKGLIESVFKNQVSKEEADRIDHEVANIIEKTRPKDLDLSEE
jgi:hypothetical protein